jgi:ribosomal protein L40E
MKRIFTAGNRIDAYLVVDRLAHAGIKAHVFNENMSSIVGDVPPDVAQPQVWLDDDADLERARGVLAAFQAERSRSGTLVCRRCGEENPATFELCWSCGGAL